MSIAAKITLTLAMIIIIAFIVSLSGFIFCELRMEQDWSDKFVISALSSIGAGVLLAIFILLRWVWRIF